MDTSNLNNSKDECDRLRKELGDVRDQLERADVEFEEFVSRAAHNLRQSLREVSSFSQLIAENYAAVLDSEGTLFLRKLQEGAGSAQSLLADVVDYWATGPGERQFSRTDMENVLRQAMLYAEKQIAETSAAFTHDPLPAVMGDFELLTKVLHHLIKNAIEYCSAPAPRIHVSAVRADLDWVISVEDNGPGIEPAMQSRVFQAFRRLHGADYPGNGLGLAFCKKAIEGQGGQIWVESRPGTGSKFYFRLPAVD